MPVPQTTQTRRERRLADRTARHEVRGARRSARGRLSLGALSVLGLVGGLAVIVLAIVFGARPTPTAVEPAVVAIAHAPAGLATDGFVLGRAEAPVTVDLYEDFQCPVCGTWGRTIFPSLVSNELAAGAVKIAFHDMAFLGAESTAAGRAAYAAAQQGRFWDMWATLYANQGRENAGAFSGDRLTAMASQLGLDMTRFETDMASPAALASIDGSRRDAGLAGITSTPTLVIGGQTLVGLRAYPEIAAAIAGASSR